MRVVSLLTLVGCAPSGVLVDDPLRDIDVPAEDATATCTPSAPVEGAYFDERITGSIGTCDAAVHAVAGPGDAVWSMTLTSWTGAAPAEVVLTTVAGAELERWTLAAGSTVEWQAPWSGELLVSVRAADDGAADYALARACIAGCDARWTRYPVVLMHGMAGTDAFLGVLDYWYRVEETAGADGATLIVPQVDPFQTTAVRAQQWAEHLDAVVAEGRHRRFNLVGHSQGGLDARYLAAHLDPDHRVASITTIGTPHRGSAVSDVTVGALGDARLTQRLMDDLFDELAVFYGLDADQDIVGQTLQFTTDNMAAFNADVPDRPDVAMFSWAGRTCRGWDLGCQWDNGGEIVSPLLSTQHRVVSWFEGDNDGVVSVASAAWGTFLGTLPADHIDEVGQIAGATAPGFDHVAFYRAEIDRLRAAGL